MAGLADEVVDVATGQPDHREVGELEDFQANRALDEVRGGEVLLRTSHFTEPEESVGQASDGRALQCVKNASHLRFSRVEEAVTDCSQEVLYEGFELSHQLFPAAFPEHRSSREDCEVLSAAQGEGLVVEVARRVLAAEARLVHLCLQQFPEQDQPLLVAELGD